MLGKVVTTQPEAHAIKRLPICCYEKTLPRPEDRGSMATTLQTTDLCASPDRHYHHDPPSLGTFLSFTTCTTMTVVLLISCSFDMGHKGMPALHGVTKERFRPGTIRGQEELTTPPSKPLRDGNLYSTHNL